MENEHEAYAKQLLQVITDDVRVIGKDSMILLILGTFIAISIASTTDEMLMRGKMIKLPLVDLEVPITGVFANFYVVAPFMVLVIHSTVLLLLSLLGSRLERFHEAIKLLQPEQRQHLCTQLPSFYSIQFLEGEAPETFLNLISRLPTVLTIVLPLILLLWAQARLLPVRSLGLAFFYMGLVMGDVGMIFVLWPYPPGCRSQNYVALDGWRCRILAALADPLPRCCTFLLLFSMLLVLAVLTIPEQKSGTDFYMVMVIGEAGLIFLLWPSKPLCKPLAGWRRILLTLGYFLPRLCARLLLGNVVLLVPLAIYLYLARLPSPGDTLGDYGRNSVATMWEEVRKFVTDRWYDTRDLSLQGKVLTVDALPPEDINALRDGSIAEREDALNKFSPLHFRQGRDLRHANFFNAILPRLDLRAERVDTPGGQHDDRPSRITQLQGADLSWAQMQRVLLNEANLRRAKLEWAGVQEGSLLKVQMQGADLKQARLQVALLQGANLQCVQASEAQLQGANLSEASLQGADLSGADLRGAILRGASLQWANLSNAHLEGADLSGADLWCANLGGAKLQGSVLDSTSFYEFPEFPVESWSDPFDKTYCPKEKAANFKDCKVTIPSSGQESEKSASGKELQKSPTQYLVELACEDAYVARGLSEQVQQKSRPDRCSLAKELLESGCPGIVQSPKRVIDLLPERMKIDLENVVKNLEPRECFPVSSP